MSKNTRNRILLTALAALLLVTMTIGGTMAWLTAKTDKVQNVFTTADIDITLTEKNKGPFQLIPGTIYEKDPVATVLAGSEECWLYVEVVAAGSVSAIEYGIHADWKELSGVTGPNGGKVYYWKDAIPESATDTSKYILAQKGDFTNGGVKIPETLTDEDMEAQGFTAPTLTFYAYAIQTANTGETAADAWTKLYDQDLKPATT